MSQEYDLQFGDVSEIASIIRKMIGVGPYEQVAVILPQIEREDGVKIVYYPQTVAEYNRLSTLRADILQMLGLRKWSDTDPKGTLWLFPAEWYNHIPDGYPVCAISGKRKIFKHGRTDDDVRYGCLPYGIYIRRGSK